MNNHFNTSNDSPRTNRRTPNKRMVAIAVTVVLLLGIFLAQKYLFNQPEIDLNDTTHPLVKIHVIDVDQADATFIELPDHRSMVIDAGTNKAGSTVVRYIQSLGYTRIDYVVGTHPHEDHIGGLDMVINAFDIGAVYMPKIEHTSKSFTDVLEAVANKGLTVKTAKSGVTVLKEEGLSIEIIAPVKTDYKDLNDWSAVILMTYQSNRFLFMGDATTKSENDIEVDVSADFLRVGHHGSNTSSSVKFLERVAPDYAAISVGTDNSYGLPAAEAMERLNTAMSAEIYRTDLHGTLIFTSNGQRIMVTKEKD